MTLYLKLTHKVNGTFQYILNKETPLSTIINILARIFLRFYQLSDILAGGVIPVAIQDAFEMTQEY